MLERITNALSNVYNTINARALALAGSVLLFAMSSGGCAVLQWPFKGQPDRQAEQVVFMNHMDDKSIDKVCDYMIEDFGTVGELTGRAELREGKLKFEDWTSHKDDEIEDVEKLKKGKCDKDTIEDIRDLVISDYEMRKEYYPDHDFTKHKFVWATLNRIIDGKDPEISMAYLADMLEDILDSSANQKWAPYITQGLPRFSWHIHPCGVSYFSKPDHRNERWAKTTEFVFCYEGEGKLTVVYSVGEYESKTQKFKIKDPEKIFMLDILTAMNHAREDSAFVFPGSIRKRQAMGEALDYLNSHPDKVHRPEYRKAANYVASRIVLRMEYLNAAMKRPENSKNADRFENELNYYAKSALDIKNPGAVNVEHWKRIYGLAKGNQHLLKADRAALEYLAGGKEVPVEVANERYLEAEKKALEKALAIANIKRNFRRMDEEDRLRTMDDIRDMAKKDGLQTMDDANELMERIRGESRIEKEVERIRGTYGSRKSKDAHVYRKAKLPMKKQTPPEDRRYPWEVPALIGSCALLAGLIGYRKIREYNARKRQR